MSAEEEPELSSRLLHERRKAVLGNALAGGRWSRLRASRSRVTVRVANFSPIAQSLSGLGFGRLSFFRPLQLHAAIKYVIELVLDRLEPRKKKKVVRPSRPKPSGPVSPRYLVSWSDS